MTDKEKFNAIQSDMLKGTLQEKLGYDLYDKILNNTFESLPQASREKFEAFLNKEPNILVINPKEVCSECSGSGFIVGITTTTGCCGNNNPDGSCCGNGIPEPMPSLEPCPKCIVKDEETPNKNGMCESCGKEIISNHGLCMNCLPF